MDKEPPLSPSTARFRLAIDDGAGMRFEAVVGVDDDIGAAKSATVQLLAGDLPKIVAIVAANTDADGNGCELRFHDHPAGGIVTEKGPQERVVLQVGTRFALPPYQFEVLEREEAISSKRRLPSSAAMEQGIGATRTTPRRGGTAGLLLGLAGLLLGSLGTLVLVWLLGEDPTTDPVPHQGEREVPTTSTGTSTTTIVERVSIADPALVNVLIVMPRQDLDDDTLQSVQAHAEELDRALQADSDRILLSLHFLDNSSKVKKIGHLDYDRVRQALKHRQDVLLDRLPKVLGDQLGDLLGGAAAQVAQELPPWPVALHLSDRGPGSTVRIADLKRIDLAIDNTFDNTELDEMVCSEAETVGSLELRSARYRYLFTYLPVDQIPWHE